jgi:hypothetical protein
MEKFIEDVGVLGLCALERWGSFSKPHLQMVCRIYIFNVIILNNLLKKLWVEMIWILFHYDIMSIANCRRELACTYMLAWLNIIWKTKGKNTFNFVTWMSILKRCKMELMNMSSMELVFVKINFVWHIPTSWRELQHSTNTRCKRTLVVFF